MGNKRWHFMKKQLKSFTCEALNKRIDFQVMRYRKAHDEFGRAVITVDHREVWSMCTLTQMNKCYEKECEMKANWIVDQQEDASDFSYRISEQAIGQLAAEGIFALWHFYEAVDIFLQSPIQQSLTSENLIVKSLALIDRRVGKRTLIKIGPVMQREHALIQHFYAVRCEAEQLRTSVH